MGQDGSPPTGEPTSCGSSNTEASTASEGPAKRLSEEISGNTFDQWYRERQWSQNILEGKSYFNGSNRVKPAWEHSPSQLPQCSRQIYYRQLNAPSESEEPSGIYWFGSQLEEELILDFLQSVTAEDEYVTNSVWISFTERTDVGEIGIRGSTDPVIVDREADPLLLTEVKSKRTIDNLRTPDLHHKAQAMAYMRGLTEKFDKEIPEAVIIYISRTSLQLRSFHVNFDPDFWKEKVLTWIEDHTSDRLNEDLPDADPIFDWECDFCQFKERCGQGEKRFSDTPPDGLLPLFTYPEKPLTEYLAATDWKLTPTLAHQHPDLVDEYGVFNFQCQGCRSSYAWDSIEWSGKASSPPKCPTCKSNNELRILRGPTPDRQIAQMEKDKK